MKKIEDKVLSTEDSGNGPLKEAKQLEVNDALATTVRLNGISQSIWSSLCYTAAHKHGKSVVTFRAELVKNLASLQVGNYALFCWVYSTKCGSTGQWTGGDNLFGFIDANDNYYLAYFVPK